MPLTSFVPLGNTPISVSRLSFGTVFMGPRGDDLTVQEGVGLLLHAYKRGINFWDTSEDYGTHGHIACALEKIPRQQVVISSKLNLPVRPVDGLLKELNTNYIDILLVHDVGIKEIDAAKAALQSLQREKAAGKVCALGLSTHSALVADAAAEWPDVEVLMLPINQPGLCLPDQPIEGGIDKMESAAKKARLNGKGIVAMKVLGFGRLAGHPKEAIEHVASLNYVDTLCIGMRTRAEIDQNVEILLSCEVHSGQPLRSRR